MRSHQRLQMLAVFAYKIHEKPCFPVGMVVDEGLALVVAALSSVFRHIVLHIKYKVDHTNIHN